MKSILMSISPQWCELIASGKKTIEVRKTAPKETPFKVYMYETKGKRGKPYWINNLNGEHSARGFKRYYYEGSGKVICEFVCYKVDTIDGADAEIEKASCMSLGDLYRYAKGKDLKALHISDLKIYDKPKELGEFRRLCKDYVNDYMNDCDDFCGYAENGLCCNGYIPVTRPPQSWCYVEEVER